MRRGEISIKRYYFGDSQKVEDKRKRLWLKNKKGILVDILFFIWVKKPSLLERNDLDRIRWFHETARKNNRNSFFEKELRELISLLEKSLKLQPESKKSNDDLIDYMYFLVDQHEHLHGKEIKKTYKNTYDPYYKPESKRQDLTENVVRYKRNTILINNAIESADYKCQVDNSHEFFISSNSNRNYVEGHHLIPLQFHKEFDYSLDVLENIVSLCVVCHKKIHHGLYEDKINIIRKLYNSRRYLLSSKGLSLDLDRLLSFYTDRLEEDV